MLCNEVLEHLPRPAAALQELFRVTRRYVLLSVPWEPWFRILNLLRGRDLMRCGNHPEHIHHWSPSAFRAFVTAQGDPVTLHIAFPWIIVLAEKRAPRPQEISAHVDRECT